MEVRKWSGWVAGEDKFELQPYGYTISMNPDEDRKVTFRELLENQIFDPDDENSSGDGPGENRPERVARKYRDYILRERSIH